jgi:atypical dual specificity phosphatase
MHRFYWVIADRLAGCSLPGGADRRESRAADAAQAALQSDLALLRRKGVGAVLTLTESPLADSVLGASELAYLHLPVPDLHAPTPAQLAQAIRFIDQNNAEGRAVAVHCLMGQGRTGTVLAAYLIRNGLTAAEALAEIRHLCDGAISAPEQEDALRAFATRRDWVV